MKRRLNERMTGGNLRYGVASAPSHNTESHIKRQPHIRLVRPIF
jgi:hypothetical protein